MDFGILGPLEARSNGHRLVLGGPKQRALLALLLLQADRIVSSDQLIEELWPDRPPAAARHTLAVNVSRLRAALADGGGDPILLTRAPGYLLRVGPEELDLRRFERRLAEGRRALEAGDAERAARTLREAEGLWRGRALADLEFEPFARLESARLEELRLVAVEERIEAELSLGRHAALAGELDALVAEHPLRERLRGQLMLALYRSGRQADALASYRTARSLLVDELGLEPGPQLMRLEQAILRHDDALGLPHAEHRAPAAVTSPEPAPVPAAAPARTSRAIARRAIAAAAAVVLAAAVALATHGRGSHARATGNALALVSPGGGEFMTAAPLRGPPTRIAAGFGSLWATHFDAGTVARVDAGDARVAQTIRVGSGPSGIAAGAGAVWVANSLDGTVSRIDPVSQAVVQTLDAGRRPTDVAVAQGSVWVADAGEPGIARFDARSGRPRGTIPLAAAPTALAVGGDAIWVASAPSRSVSRIDARTGAVGATVPVGGGASAIAAGAGAVWVANGLDGTVSRIDPARNAVSATIPVGNGPAALAVRGDAVWVANEYAGTLSRIDPATGRVTSTAPGDGEPASLAVLDGRLWVGTRDRGPSHRGGRLVLLNPNRAFDSIDPATSTELFPPALLGMTNDGLVTFKHVGGIDGTDVVPDLAVSLPTATDGGRTYAFTLRRGIRYSTGRPVRASDIRYALERLFERASPGTVFYEGIVGARACERAPRRCDLSRGVIADDHTGAVTIRLRAADPELLYKLALPFAYAVPAGSPRGDIGTRPLPATGPYRITSYQRGRELRLVRNEAFREWSRAAQPDGYPDEIVWRLGVGADASVDAIERGRADWMLGWGTLPAERRRELVTRYASQLHTHGTLSTDYLVLNVRRAPFDDVRARRAINYAIDRRAAVRLFGGRAGAAPTCQVLPPQMPGYRRYCPYTAGGAAGGAWRAPDLVEARRLVRASGTAGMRVVVLDSLTPRIFLDEGRLAVDALRRIGYRARLKLLPEDVFTRIAGNTRKVSADVISGGWGADYPAASDFVQLKLSCSAFHPASGDNPNVGGFCSPRLDERIDRARRLQVADPTRANRLWSQIDRALVDRAAWLPLVTPTNTTFVSARVGNYRYHPLWGPLVDQFWVR